MSGKRIMRVFPRRTRATPTDELVAIGREPHWFDEADEVHVSVAFSWDLPFAETLASAWRPVAPVKVGGPAAGDPGGDFDPGMYLAHGYTITTRGCPNTCWFCDVWSREGRTRELPMRDGWNVLDSNLLAASEAHIRAVFAMLARQKHRAEFTGGLEAVRLQPWHVDLLVGLKPRPAIFLAYDEPRDLEPLQAACRTLLDAGWKHDPYNLRCYVLCGWQGDTMQAAEARLQNRRWPLVLCPWPWSSAAPMAASLKAGTPGLASGIRPALIHRRSR